MGARGRGGGGDDAAPLCEMLRESLPGFKAILGLAGGVGAGKSTCRAWLAARGALCLDCDRLAHACYAPGGAAYPAVAALFPSALEAPGGPLDRRRLGELVFSDPAALAALNAAVWPALLALVQAELAAAGAAAAAVGGSGGGSGSGGLVGVVEAAILLEAGWGARMDGVWLLEAPREAALARLQGGRGLSAAAAEARVAAQPTAAARLASPAGASVTCVIGTGGTLAETEALYEAAWRDFLAKADAAAVHSQADSASAAAPTALAAPAAPPPPPPPPQQQQQPASGSTPAA